MGSDTFGSVSYLTPNGILRSLWSLRMTTSFLQTGSFAPFRNSEQQCDKPITINKVKDLIEMAVFLYYVSYPLYRWNLSFEVFRMTDDKK